MCLKIVMIRIMMLLMVILIKILCDFSEILLWSKHRWHIYVSRQSILSPLWIPGCLYVRVCMAICVSACWPNKHPQTVGNLWPPIFKKEKLGTDLIPAQEQHPLSLKQRLCCFQKYLMPVSRKLFQSLGQVSLKKFDNHFTFTPDLASQYRKSSQRSPCLAVP